MPRGADQQNGQSAGRRSRVSVKDLIDAGLLKPSDELQFAGRNDIRARVTPQGKVLLKGVEYSSPSSAASSVTGTSLNGWVIWRIRSGSPERITLADLRSRLQR